MPDCLFLFALGHRILTGLFVLKAPESGGMLASRLENPCDFVNVPEDSAMYFRDAERCIVSMRNRRSGLSTEGRSESLPSAYTGLDKIRELVALELENSMIRCRDLHSLLLLEKMP